MIKDKKARASTEHWAEWASLALLVGGMLLSLISGSAIISYIIIFLCGIFVGRVLILRKNEIGFPFFMITLFFLIGYFIGITIRGRGIVFLGMAFFLIGVYIGRYLHAKRYFK